MLVIIMFEIGWFYVLGVSSVLFFVFGWFFVQVWLVDLCCQLLIVFGLDYVEWFVYNFDGVVVMMGEFVVVLVGCELLLGLFVEELLLWLWWSGLEIFLIVDDIQQLLLGFDLLLYKVVLFVNRVVDVGLYVIVMCIFGGWLLVGSDLMLWVLYQVNVLLLVMDVDFDEGFICGKMKGGLLFCG